MKQQVKEWCGEVKGSSLTSYGIQVSYLLFLRLQVSYPLPCLTVSEHTLTAIWRPVLHVLLHSYSALKKIPRELRHSGPEFFGLALDNLYVIQGMSQLRFFMGHANQQDRTSTL